MNFFHLCFLDFNVILCAYFHCNFFMELLMLIISSPEPKAKVSFSDQNLSVVRRCCRRRRKLFTFSSSPEPLGQFQPNLAQSMLG